MLSKLNESLSKLNETKEERKARVLQETREKIIERAKSRAEAKKMLESKRDRSIMEKREQMLKQRMTEQKKKMFEQEMTKDQKDQALEIMASVMAVGLAQIEDMSGVQFASAKEASDVAQDLLQLLRTKGKTTLMSALRRFERMGGERTKQVFRRGLR